MTDDSRPESTQALPARVGILISDRTGAWLRVQYTGCTVSFVEEALDAGAIVLQRRVAVEEDDTAESLTERSGVQERIAYLEAIQRVLSGEYEQQGRRYLLREDLRFTAQEAEGTLAEVSGAAASA